MENGHLEYWRAKLSELKTQKGFRTNKELAQFLGLSKTGLANVRSGRQELSVPARLAVLSELDGVIYEDDYTSLFTRKTRQELGDEIERLFDPEEGSETGENDEFWVDRIDELKYRFRVKTDKDLAKSLFISPSVISDQRAGKHALGTVAKIRILDKLAYTAARSLLLDLFPAGVKKKFKNFDDFRFRKRGDKRLEK